MENVMQKVLIYSIIFSFQLVISQKFAYASAKGRQKMKHIEVALISIPKKIDPMKILTYHQFFMVQAMYANLVRVNEDGRIVSQLASKWIVSSDLKVFELTLNPKATFSDGSQITSHDVAYSLARHCWKGSGSILQGYLIDTVEGMSDLTENKIPTGITTPDQKTIKIKKHRLSMYCKILCFD